MVYIPRGELDLAFQKSKDSLRMVQESGDRRTTGIAHFAYGSCCYYKRLSNEAETSLLKAESFCKKTTDFFWGAWASNFLGDIYFDRGKYEIAMRWYDKTISYLELSKSVPSYLSLCKILKVRAKIFNKTQYIDINELSRLYNNNNLKCLEGWMARIISEILINIDDQHISEAGEWCKWRLKSVTIFMAVENRDTPIHFSSGAARRWRPCWFFGPGAFEERKGCTRIWSSGHGFDWS
jgi:tetratricopeptide (TPR) repeat protein